jgi:hypothetical protein
MDFTAHYNKDTETDNQLVHDFNDSIILLLDFYGMSIITEDGRTNPEKKVYSLYRKERHILSRDNKNQVWKHAIFTLMTEIFDESHRLQ